MSVETPERAPLASDGEDTSDDPTRPESDREYIAWLWENHGIGTGPEVRAEYESTASLLALRFEETAFWRDLPPLLESANAEYKVRRAVPLLGSGGNVPSLVVKPWPSFWEKTYRLNVAGNERWPDAPARGWILPDTWFAQISDIVRTKLIVRYLDGMPLVADVVRRAANENGLATVVGRIARNEGYYATHVDVAFPIVVSNGVTSEKRASRVEFQITTELQENIYDLTHAQYVTSRIGASSNPTAWQWDYQSDAFAANYLGHVLHYLEGMIMRLREGRV